MRLTTRDVLLLMMPALVVLVVLAFGTMLALGYGSFVPADETMIRPQVLVASSLAKILTAYRRNKRGKKTRPKTLPVGS